MIPEEYHFNGLGQQAMLDRVVPGTELIVLGDAPNAAAQYERALEILPYAHLMVVNNAVRRVPDQVPQLVATLHGGKKDFIGTQRMPTEPMHDALLICENKCGWEHERVDLIYHGYHTGGTSALFAVLSAIYLGYDKILMAGCDITHPAYASSGVLATWTRWSPLLCHRVSSLGGNTKRILEEAVSELQRDTCG